MSALSDRARSEIAGPSGASRKRIAAPSFGRRPLPPLAGALTAGLLAAAALGCGGGDGGDVAGPTPQATLTAPTFTAGPSERQSVSLRMSTNRAAAGLQVDVLSPPEVIPEIDGVVSDGRAASLANAVVQNLARGHARVVLFDPEGGNAIPAGEGSILLLSFRVDANAPAGTAAITLSDGLVVDADAQPFEVTLEPGQVTIR